MDTLERTFREMRAADQMRATQQKAAEQRQRPGFIEALGDATREVMTDPKGVGSIAAELAYAVEDIRQKVVEAPTYGQEVTPSVHGDPLMRQGAQAEIGVGEFYGQQQGGEAQQGGGLQQAQRDSAWNKEPTPKQAAILEGKGYDPSEFTRGTASQKIETFKGFDQSWYQFGNDPLMQAYREHRELKPEDLYGKMPEQEKDQEQAKQQHSVEH